MKNKRACEKKTFPKPIVIPYAEITECCEFKTNQEERPELAASLLSPPQNHHKTTKIL
jgi:hypothetical protein